MNKMLKPVIVLALIASISAIILAFVNQITKQRIEEYENSVLQSALEKVSCGYSIGSVTSVEDKNYISSYHTLSQDSDIIGYILNLQTNGYGGIITMVASFRTDGSVMSVSIVSDSETPGVGKRAENPTYMKKFIGTGNVSNPVPKAKSDLSDVDAASVSGATMTFTGIVKALSAGSEFVLSLGGNQ